MPDPGATVCPKCGDEHCKVFDSRRRADADIRQRRVCLSCGERWTTIVTTPARIAAARIAAVGQVERGLASICSGLKRLKLQSVLPN